MLQHGWVSVCRRARHLGPQLCQALSLTSPTQQHVDVTAPQYIYSTRYLCTVALPQQGTAASRHMRVPPVTKTLKRKASGPAATTPAGPSGTSQGAYAALNHGWTDLGDGCLLGYWPNALEDLCQQHERRLLQSDYVGWQQRSIVLFGKPVQQPRLIAYMADSPQLAYTYSGATLQPSPWLPEVLAIKEAAEQLASQRLPGTRFNSCLLNLYRSGQDHISWHSDNEPLYGSQPTIASVSLGAARDFQLKRVQPCTPPSASAPQGSRTGGKPTPPAAAGRGGGKGGAASSRAAAGQQAAAGEAALPAAAGAGATADRLQAPLGQGAVLVMAGAMQQHWLHCLPKRKGAEGSRINLTFRQIVQPQSQLA